MDGFEEMRRYVSAFPTMWEAMWDASSGFMPDLPVSPRAILLNGMGGSSIGGALLEALAGDDASVPFIINRTYTVPAWVDSTVVAVCTSYSGNTEETLSAFETAGKQGAHRVAITTGGKLARRCDEQGVPYQRIPPGLPPRAALPYTFVPLLNLARHMRLLELHKQDIQETTSLLIESSEAESDGKGPAKGIAMSLHGKIPVVYSGPGLLSAVNLRWRGQLQENAKSVAFGNVYPELNHNEIVGWEASSSVTREIVVIELADRDDDDAIKRRMELTRSLLADRADNWITVESRGTSRLARMMWTVLLGDWVSLHLAGLKQVDPMPVALIDALKSGLAGPR